MPEKRAYPECTNKKMYKRNGVYEARGNGWVGNLNWRQHQDPTVEEYYILSRLRLQIQASLQPALYL